MQSAQEIYDSVVSHLPISEQLRLAILILEGMMQVYGKEESKRSR